MKSLEVANVAALTPPRLSLSLFAAEWTDTFRNSFKKGKKDDTPEGMKTKILQGVFFHPDEISSANETPPILISLPREGSLDSRREETLFLFFSFFRRVMSAFASVTSALFS